MEFLQYIEYYYDKECFNCLFCNYKTNCRDCFLDHMDDGWKLMKENRNISHKSYHFSEREPCQEHKFA